MIQKLVAASDTTDAYVEFSGVTRLKQGVSPSGLRLDDAGPSANLSRAATLAVTDRKHLLRRLHLQSY